MYQITLFKERKKFAHADFDDQAERIFQEDNPRLYKQGPKVPQLFDAKDQAAFA